jgi:hypothetical protein
MQWTNLDSLLGVQVVFNTALYSTTAYIDFVYDTVNVEKAVI